MDIKQLRYFLGVVEAKSFTKAADVLHVAQPAIGMQIRKLEDELGVPLLVRHSRGITPTEAGDEMARQARSILRAVELAHQRVTDVAGEPRGKIVLGMTTTVMHALAGLVAEACHRKYPQVSLNIVEAMSGRLTEWIVEDRLDLSLGYAPMDKSVSEQEPLADEAMHLIVPAAHPLADASEVVLREAVVYEFVVPSFPSVFLPMLEKFAKAEGKEIRIACVADSVAGTIELVRHGVGCAIMPYDTVSSEVRQGSIVALPIVNPQLKRTLYLTCMKDRLRSRALEVVQEEIHAVARGLIESEQVRWTRAGTGETVTPDI